MGESFFYSPPLFFLFFFSSGELIWKSCVQCSLRQLYRVHLRCSDKVRPG